MLSFPASSLHASILLQLVFQVSYSSHIILSSTSISPLHPPLSNITNPPSPPSNKAQIALTVRHTYMVITQNTNPRTIPTSQTTQLFIGANGEIQRKIARHGGDALVLEDYTHTYQNIQLQASPNLLDAKMTYDMIADYIYGLERNLARMANVECTTDLFLTTPGGEKPHAAGRGTLTVLNNNDNGLKDDDIQIRVRHTDMTISKTGQGMPAANVSSHLQAASVDIRGEIAYWGGYRRLQGGAYEFAHAGLRIRAWQWPEDRDLQVTYDIVEDMITGLEISLQRLGYRECGVTLYAVVEWREFQVGKGTLGLVERGREGVGNASVASS